MKKLANLFLAGLAIIYPLLAVILLRHVSAVWLICLLLVALLLRLWIGGKSAPLSLIFASIAAIVGISITAFYDQDLSIRLYPVFMGAAMLCAFTASLIRGPSVIERFARLAEPDLPDHAVAYTYKVTIIWCVFMAINVGVATWTVFHASIETWALYNGFVAYVFMGALFLGELIYRKFIRPKS